MNPLRSWVIAGSIAGGVALLLLALKVILGRRLATLAKTTETDVDDLAAELIARTRWYFIIALALRSGGVVLTLTPGIDRAIRQVAAIAVLLQLAVWGSTLIQYALRKWAGRHHGDQLGEATIKAISFGAKGLMWAIILVLALRNVLDYDITALLTGLGIGGIAIALAVQNILGDLFAALSIVLDRPFDVGDAIQVDNDVGTVEKIGLKTTRIRSVTGEQVIFSNADLLRSRVRNLRRIQERRVLQNIGIPFDTPADHVAALPAVLRRCVESQTIARFDRAHLARFTDSWLEFELVYFVKSPDYVVYMNTLQAINLEILRAFDSNGYRFALPTTRTVQSVADHRAKNAG